jgi:hypothetical protein
MKLIADAIVSGKIDLMTKHIVDETALRHDCYLRRRVI